jgi:hypothetical protein
MRLVRIWSKRIRRGAGAVWEDSPDGTRRPETEGNERPRTLEGTGSQNFTAAVSGLADSQENTRSCI